MFERDDDDDAVSGGGLSSGTLLRRESAPAEVVLGGWADIYGRVFFIKKSSAWVLWIFEIRKE